MTRGTCGLTGDPLGLIEVIGALLTVGGPLGLTRGPWGVRGGVPLQGGLLVCDHLTEGLP